MVTHLQLSFTPKCVIYLLGPMSIITLTRGIHTHVLFRQYKVQRPKDRMQVSRISREVRSDSQGRIMKQWVIPPNMGSFSQLCWLWIEGRLEFQVALLPWFGHFICLRKSFERYFFIFLVTLLFEGWFRQVLVFRGEYVRERSRRGV